MSLPVLLRANGAGAQDTALAQLATQIMTRLYVHLNVEVIDAGYAKANELAPTGGRLPDELPMRVHDPGAVRRGRRRKDLAAGFLAL